MKEWMRITEVALALGVSPQTAMRHVRSGVIPGGELLYKLEDGRERWRVNRARFLSWRESQPAHV